MILALWTLLYFLKLLNFLKFVDELDEDDS